MADLDLKELLELLGQEQACYTALIDLSRQQRAAIEQSDMVALTPLLGQKHSVLRRIAGVELQLRPYKMNWKTFRVQLNRQDRQVLDMALATVEELLSELISHERDSESILLAKESFLDGDSMSTQQKSAA